MSCLAEAPLRCKGISFFSPHPPGPPRLHAHWLTGMPGLSFVYCMPVGWILWGSAASSSILAHQSLLHQLLVAESMKGMEDMDGVVRIKKKGRGRKRETTRRSTIDFGRFCISSGNYGRLTALTSKSGRARDFLYSLQHPVKANPSSCKGVVLTG